ncbi:hypothetical protein [Leptospira licerasiae]|uniref:hypothetical protein n=1 Tax=Leptospira licerasiae TaxID=447106 RepID=UPI0030161F35
MNTRDFDSISYSYKNYKCCHFYSSESRTQVSQADMEKYLINRINLDWRKKFGKDLLLPNESSKVHLNISIYLRRIGAGFTADKALDKITDFWWFTSRLTGGIIPYYGKTGIIIEYEVIIQGNQYKTYKYMVPTKEISFILLAPLFWLNLTNGDFREDYVETFVNLIDDLNTDRPDLGLKKIL